MAGLAREYLAAVEHVVGKQPAIRAISIEDDHDRAAKQAGNPRCGRRRGRRIRRRRGDRHVRRLAVEPEPARLRARDRRILYGANLPMLVKLAKSRQRVCEAVACALDAGRKYINSYAGGGEGSR